MKWVLAFALCMGLCGWSVAQTCGMSRDCGAGHCCRNMQTQANLVDDRYNTWDSQLGVTGQCVAGTAQPGAYCDSICQCSTGYECYRPVTGACCAPSTCIMVAEAEAHRHFWNCHLPPPAAPADAETRRRRSMLFDALCPDTIVPGVPAMPGAAAAP